MHDIATRLEEQGLFVAMTEDVRARLAEIGFDPLFGARPLRRALQRYIESPLSVQLLKGEFKRGDLVEVYLNENKEIDFRCIESGHIPAPVETKVEHADAE